MRLATRSGAKKSCGWLKVEKSEGREAVEQIYGQVLGGSADPSLGLLLAV